MRNQQRKPIAVIISDVHYSVPTLEVADDAMQQAVSMTNKLKVPLIVAGDLHDTKANMRGECVNAMLNTFATVHADLDTFILRGNHDALNEKSKEHSLNFLKDRATVIDALHYASCISAAGTYFIPYQHDVTAFKFLLDKIPKGRLIICHQGVTDANMGEYVLDRSAVPIEWFAEYRTISGHYHPRQDIKAGRPQQGAVGLFSYIGNPYTLTFGEANDPEKGYQILYDDGLLEFVPTNLRKHVIINIEANDEGQFDYIYSSAPLEETDIVRVKITATKEELTKFSKKLIAAEVGLKQDFRLDLVPVDMPLEVTIAGPEVKAAEVLDSLVDRIQTTDSSKKERLKALWRTFA